MQKKSGFPVSQEPHQFQQQLLKAGALQSAIFSSANFSCIATDDQGVIQIFNVGAERMLGYKAEEVVDRVTPIRFTDANELLTRAAALSQELGTTIASGVEALVSKAVHGIEDVFELTCIRKDGSRFPVVLSVTALRDPQQNVIGYLLIATDNTARKQDEAKQILLDQRLREQQHALQETNVELEMAKLAAEKANRAKSDFLSSMSHELRTPLNAVLGFAQLMESETPSPTPAQKLSIEQILKGGWYLLHLINEILDLATIESGKVTMSLEAVSLAEVLLDCQTIIESQATRREVKIAFPPVDSLFYVHADRTRVKQVMINLLSNAIKYNRVGGTVIVKCEMRGKNTVRISVSDTGFGLRPEQVKQLFQPFNRLGQESSAEEGTGIGLVVTKQLIELMGGAIGVESTADVGSEFWVELPASGPPQVVFDKASMA
ncbi:MAG: ATP-binding protein, partial [Burkholderiaceae bacterium]